MIDQKEKAKKFAKRWKNKGSEERHKQQFWEDMLENVFGVSKPYDFIKREKRVLVDGHHRKIDIYIPYTKVLIEQKTKSISLDQKLELGTPYEQAKLYEAGLGLSEKPKWIITCNFNEFRIYDREHPYDEPIIFFLKDFDKYYHYLNFLDNPEIKRIANEDTVSVEAAKFISEVYQELISEAKKKYEITEKILNDINILCIRLVFCMFAEDAGIFEKFQFTSFINYHKNDPEALRQDLYLLFRALDKNKEDRKTDYQLNDRVKSFPHVNGGLFNKEDIFIPNITRKLINLIIKACEEINWEDISPAIFGAAYESTINPEIRKKYGMHYTTPENIHKVIDPLFLDDLKNELAEIKTYSVLSILKKKVNDFIDKLSNLKFLDPACGSGNFLTVTYEELRKLENEAIKTLLEAEHRSNSEGTQKQFNINTIKVSINQFYGIEIEDFAVSVAMVSLWIAELKMYKETLNIVFDNIEEPLPLRSYPQILKANALTMDWNELLANTECNYIISNPPYIGYSKQSKEQKKELKQIYSDENGNDYPHNGKIDYVSGWLFKSAEYIQGTDIGVALVTTNSITQGDQVEPVWNPLFERFNIDIIFGYKTFVWNSESKKKAHVHCVIIGFNSKNNNSNKKIYEDKSYEVVDNISPYLSKLPNILIPTRLNSLSNEAPRLINGNRPADGGNLIIEAKEYKTFIKKDPNSKKYIKRLLGSKEFIHKKDRYCLWLVDINPEEINQMPEVKKRISLCKQSRLNGADDRKKLATTPHLFRETNNPKSALLIPVVSSENRKYIPIDFVNDDYIVTNTCHLIPNCSLYEFGVLTSNVHMKWMETIGGRLEMRYSYSKKIVYNNFPWPNPTEEQKLKIEKTAQGILEVREKYSNCSLATLYDKDSIANDLFEAHRLNDLAVMEAYNFSPNLPDDDIVSNLMFLYQKKAS